LVGDALYLQAPFVKEVERLGLVWAFTLKENQPELLREAERLTQESPPGVQAEPCREIRYWHLPDLDWPVADRRVRVVKTVRIEHQHRESSTQASYRGMMSHLKEFGRTPLRDLTRPTLQQYFSGKAGKMPYPTISKVRDVLSSVLRSAVDVEYLNQNPMEGVRLPLDKRPRRPKPTITPKQFANLVQLVSEPYATMIFVAVWTGLRVSEVIGLKWRCIHADSITIEERYCRGDWSVPKTEASATPIGVDPEVIARLLRLPTLTVEVRAGRAIRKHKLVKSGGPDDLVFQSVQKGCPMNDHNILQRHLQPAARKLGLPFVNWRCLRTSHATWLVQSGADPKSVQGQMRHSRVSTTMDIYAQAVPASQRRALPQLSVFAGGGSLPAPRPMDLDLDFSEPENDAEKSRSNSRSKTVQ